MPGIRRMREKSDATWKRKRPTKGRHYQVNASYPVAIRSRVFCVRLRSNLAITDIEMKRRSIDRKGTKPSIRKHPWKVCSIGERKKSRNWRSIAIRYWKGWRKPFKPKWTRCLCWTKLKLKRSSWISSKNFDIWLTWVIRTNRLLKFLNFQGETTGSGKRIIHETN